MRKTLILVTTAALLTSTAITGSAVARDRSDRPELTSSQITDQASARAAQMKADLRLTAEQEKNWPAFETAVVDMWKKQAEQHIAWRNAHAKQQGSVDLIDEMRKDADQQIDEPMRGRSSQTPPNRFTAASTISKSAVFRVVFPQGS